MLGTHARLGMNEIKYYSWKGQTINQITTIMKFNNTSAPKTYALTRKPLPIKHYRKEIGNLAGNNSSVSCSRSSIKMADFEMPGVAVVNSVDPRISDKPNGLVNTMSLDTTTLSAENGVCKGCVVDNGIDPFSPAANARRRVRSAGMLPKKFNQIKNYDKYYTSTNEFLVSRNRAIGMRDYTYFRNGASGVQPGTGNSKSNIYTHNGYSHCALANISSSVGNNTFQYVWVNGSTYTVTIPNGAYSVDDLNNVFRQAMVSNTHYFINDTNSSKNFLLSIDYNTYDNTIIINATPASKSFPYNTLAGGTYSVPIGATWYAGMDDTNQSNTFFIVGTAGFSTLLGISIGTYGGRTASTAAPTIAPRYDTLYYKPSNIIFGTQGAVDSSTYSHRKKYNAVNKGGYLAKTAYGAATANAMAYGVSEQPTTLKDIVGFKNTKTPVINPITGEKCCKEKFIYRRG